MLLICKNFKLFDWNILFGDLIYFKYIFQVLYLKFIKIFSSFLKIVDTDIIYCKYFEYFKIKFIIHTIYCFTFIITLQPDREHGINLSKWNSFGL